MRTNDCSALTRASREERRHAATVEGSEDSLAAFENEDDADAAAVEGREASNDFQITSALESHRLPVVHVRRSDLIAGRSVASGRCESTVAATSSSMEKSCIVARHLDTTGWQATGWHRFGRWASGH